jgi:hypothetical protein
MDMEELVECVKRLQTRISDMYLAIRSSSREEGEQDNLPVIRFMVYFVQLLTVVSRVVGLIERLKSLLQCYRANGSETRHETRSLAFLLPRPMSESDDDVEAGDNDADSSSSESLPALQTPTPPELEDGR